MLIRQHGLFSPKRLFVATGGAVGVLVCVLGTVAYRSYSERPDEIRRTLSSEPPLPFRPDIPVHSPTPTALDSQSPRPLLVDVAELVGFDFRYYSDGHSDRFFLPEIMGGGSAWLDYDGDGWLDLFVPNGCKLSAKVPDTQFSAHLYRNRRGSWFDDVTMSAGAEDRGYGQGVCAGDYNSDGFPDLYVTHYGTNRLWTNNGDGTFSEHTLLAGVHSSGWSTSCVFGDLDRDGDLDLYVCHYAQTTIETTPVCLYSSASGGKVRGYCGPDRYTGEPGELYENLGDGTFQEITKEAGCFEPNGKGLAVVIADLNNDSWPDIYVANDMQPNSLFWNLGGRLRGSRTHIALEEGGVSAGAALTAGGRAGASMGIGCADYDHNGWLDLAVTNYLDQGMNLYKNEEGQFLDYAAGANLFLTTLPYLGFGTGFFDCDNDGWADIFVTNGHVLGPLVGPPDRMRGQLFQNLRNGRYAEVSDVAGPYFYERFLGRGLAFADFTNSGATGMVVIHQDEPAALLRNDTAGRGNYLGLNLRGTSSNRCALNARVVAWVDGDRRIMEVVGGGSYLSESDHRLLFGIGQAKSVDRIEIHWPSGASDEWANLAANQYWVLVEGLPPRQSSPSGLEKDARP